MKFLENIVTDNVNIIDYIGQYTSLEEKNGEYAGLCPFHSERTPSFYVNPETKKWYCFGCKKGGNIISFVARMESLSYDKAALKLSNDFNVGFQPYNVTETEKIFSQVKSSKQDNEAVTHTILDKSIYDIFSKTDIPLWQKEGILPSVLNKYEVRMDLNKARIVYPVYDNCGNFINIKGRTVYSDYKDLSEPKYINYYKVGKVDYFQGFFQNFKFIKEKKEIIIFEGIKSVMKLDGFGWQNSVSAETSKINDYQLQHLIKLGVDIVIAFDNDVKFDNIKDTLYMLSHFTNVYYIEDKGNLLADNKMSPVDKGKNIWDELYQNKRRILLT